MGGPFFGKRHSNFNFDGLRHRYRYEKSELKGYCAVKQKKIDSFFAIR